jgi:hypothetical protein
MSNFELANAGKSIKNGYHTFRIKSCQKLGSKWTDYSSVTQTMYRGTKLPQENSKCAKKLSPRKGVMSNFFTFELAKVPGHKSDRDIPYV